MTFGFLNTNHLDCDHNKINSGPRLLDESKSTATTLAEMHFPTNKTVQAGESPVAESSDSESEDANDDEEYVDLEDDSEKVPVVSLFDNTVFEDVPTMLAHVKSSNGFDLVSVRRRFGKFIGIVLSPSKAIP